LLVSIECPLILLVQLKWRKGRALGREEANVMRKCFVVSLHWREVKCKVKYSLVQALRLCTGRIAHRGSRGIALLFED
jgi:hypothetical protein